MKENSRKKVRKCFRRVGVILVVVLGIGGCVNQRSVVIPPEDIGRYNDPDWKIQKESRRAQPPGPR